MKYTPHNNKTFRDNKHTYEYNYKINDSRLGGVV